MSLLQKTLFWAGALNFTIGASAKEIISLDPGHIQQSRPLAGPTHITIENIEGNLEIYGSDRRELRFEGEIEGKHAAQLHYDNDEAGFLRISVSYPPEANELIVESLGGVGNVGDHTSQIIIGGNVIGGQVGHTIIGNTVISVGGSSSISIRSSSANRSVALKIFIPKHLLSNLAATVRNGLLRVEDFDINPTPPERRISLKSNDGNIFASNLTAKSIAVRTRNGEAEIKRIQGDLDLESNDGDVSIGDVAGALQSKSRNGHQTLDKIASAGAIAVTTNDGHFAISNSEGELIRKGRNGSTSVGSHQGDIDIEVNDGSVETQSTVGRISVEARNGSVEVKGHKGAVTVTTRDGAIDLGNPEATSERLSTRRGRISGRTCEDKAN